MQRYVPHVVVAAGLALSFVGVSGGACSLFMGAGSSFAASDMAMADRVFQTMLVQLVACVVAIAVGAAMFVFGIVLWRRRPRDAAPAPGDQNSGSSS